MDGIGVIIFIIAAIGFFSKLAKNASKVNGNRPGSTPPPTQNQAPQWPRANEWNPTNNTGNFWDRLNEMLAAGQEEQQNPTQKMPETPFEDAPDPSYEYLREYQHGSLPTSHEEHGALHDRLPVLAESDRKATVPATIQAARPAFNQAEMRRAVIMSEILTRPSERRGRWQYR